MRLIATTFLSLLLVACAAPVALVRVPPGFEPVARQVVFVGSNRVFAEDGFGIERAEELSFARYEISIPPDRAPGELETPGRRNADPTRHFMLADRDIYPTRQAFQAELRQTLRQLPADNREVTVFIHGFNNNFASGLFRISQIAHDYGETGITAHFSWPSAAHPLGYAYDRDSVLFARGALETFLDSLQEAGARRIFLVAHSMGSHLLMEVLRQARIAGDDVLFDRLSGVALMSPDIDVDVFRSQLSRIGDLPEPFAIFTSSRDRALRLSARITGHENRLGTLDSAEELAEFDVTLFDFTAFSGDDGDRLNHSTAITSPSVIQLLSSFTESEIQRDGTGLGLLPGTILTVRNATQVLLTPNLQ